MKTGWRIAFSLLIVLLFTSCSLITSIFNPAPTTPTGLTVTAGSTSTSLVISWSAATRASSYELYRDTSSTGAFSTLVASPKTTTYTDTGLTTATVYYYKVKAISSGGTESELSVPPARRWDPSTGEPT